MKRYALQDSDGTYSAGGVWKSTLPADADLMTGQEVDAFAKLHPRAVIIDVLVVRERAKAWLAAFHAFVKASGYDRASTDHRHAIRVAARHMANARIAVDGYITPNA
jgi:hypothetical protein